MYSVLSWLQEYSVAIQAIGSVILVVVTIIYVIETRKIARQGAPSGWLEPEILHELFGPSISFDITNIGPGHAVGVEVYLTLKVEPSEYKNGRTKKNIREVRLKGQTRILEGETVEFSYKSDYVFTYENMKLRIKWKSITGMNFRHTWIWGKNDHSNEWVLK